MTAGAPWSVKGIEPKTREIAKDLARRSGMTLGEWLNRMIAEGESPASFGSTLDDGFQSPEEPVVLAMPRAGAAARYEVPGHPADEVGRVTQALERLTARIEAAEQRSTLAITGIDQSVRGALSRLEGAEREQTAVAARMEGVVDELRTEHGQIGERLRRIELESSGPRSTEALRALEGMLGKVAGQLYDGEARTRETLAGLEARLESAGGPDLSSEVEAISTRLSDVEQAVPGNLVEAVAARVAERLEQAETRTTEALRDLGGSFVALDRRLRKVEGGGGSERLEALAADLTRRMEDTRAEMARKLAESADGRFDRMDHKLSEMASHIQTAETRSAQAIERMGREMVGVADTLSRRVQGVEQRGADAIEQVGGEVARIASAVEQKLGRADTAQAQALEKLGSEIARITERLAERIANSERRGALAIDEVGEQVARITERIGQRQERTATDLAERIRQSEERTAKLLDEAREKIDASLNSSHRRLAEQVSQGPVAQAPAAPPKTGPARTAFEDPFAEPFPAAGQSIPEDTFAPHGFASQAFARAPDITPPAEPAPFPVAERGAPAFSPEDFEAADGFAPIDEAEALFQAPRIPDAPEIPPLDIDQPARPRSTREVIEQARLAARSASQPERAPAVEKTGLFGSRGKKSKRRAGNALQSALVVAVGLATVGALTGGVVTSLVSQGEATSPRVAAQRQIADADARGEIMASEADIAPVAGQAPRMAIAVGPQGMAPAGPGAIPGVLPAGPATGESAATLYAEGVRRIEARDFTGVETLRRAANAGHAPAQFYLAKLYENGEGGLRKDAPEARRWTERAAQGGDSRAMHNLGLYYFEGTGGAQNRTVAAQWFRKAADLGLRDSQYNLGSLYEEGYGVSQNAAEAYKWYLIAARQGDPEAKTSAERVKRELSPEARSTAERSAGGFRASAPNPSVRPPAQAQIGGTPAGVIAAQKALSTLGYYRGPQDGVASQGLKGAIAAFQREQNLTANGTLDAETLSRLSVYVR